MFSMFEQNTRLESKTSRCKNLEYDVASSPSGSIMHLSIEIPTPHPGPRWGNVGDFYGI